ncbi:MAG: hypothetical protein KGH98_05045 [Candidatus Micrarchaeota archaeon]|nr:hypothetical protein [Candidatus Micrarchaeota archaeon]
MSNESNNGDKVYEFDTLHMKEDMTFHGTVIVKNGIEGHNDKAFDLTVYGTLKVNGDVRVRDLMVEDLLYIKGDAEARNVRAHAFIGGKETKVILEGRIDAHKIDLTHLTAVNVDANNVKVSFPIKLTTASGKIYAGVYTVGHTSLMIKKEWNPDGTQKDMKGFARKEEPSKSKAAR